MKFKEFITKGTLNSYQIYTYITKAGSKFRFSYHFTSGGFYEIDIHETPNFNGRSTGLHSTHRLSSPRDTTYKICLSGGKEPRNLDLAQQISAEWADLIEIYIKTNISLDRQIAMQN